MACGIVVLQAGGDQRPADVDRVARLARRSAAALDREHLAAQRIEDDAGEQRPAGLANRDRHTPGRHASGVVGRAVEGIDDPRVRPVGVACRALLAEDRVVGIPTEQQLDDGLLRRLVGPRDDVGARRLLVDLGRPQQTFHQPLTAGSGSVDGGFQQVRVAHSGEASGRVPSRRHGSRRHGRVGMPGLADAKGVARHQRRSRRPGAARSVPRRGQALDGQVRGADAGRRQRRRSHRRSAVRIRVSSSSSSPAARCSTSGTPIPITPSPWRCVSRPRTALHC